MDRPMACLRGKAMDYVFNRPKYLCADYYMLKDMLSQRYNIAELPGTARRQLNTMRQEEQESLEDYADRVLGKVSEAYPNVEEDVAQALGTESFWGAVMIGQLHTPHQSTSQTPYTGPYNV